MISYWKQKDMSTSKYEPDVLDHEIINILTKDSRTSISEIATKLNSSRPTIMNRIKKLEEEKIIVKYTCVTNYRKLGYDLTVFVLLALDRSGSVWKITADELLKRREELDIVEIHHITGEFDVLIKMRTQNIQFLEANLHQLYSIKGVNKTNTIVCFSSFEHGHPFFDDNENPGEIKKLLKLKYPIQVQ